MEIDYFINLIIIGINTTPKTKIDINLLANNTTAYIYRGTANYKHKSYTLKLTKNGYCSLYIKNNYSSIINNIEKFVRYLYYKIISKYCTENIYELNVFIKNTQITFTIIFEIIPTFSVFLINIYKYFSNNCSVTLEVKESNSFESVWLNFHSTRNTNNISYLRIKYKKTIFTVSHSYKGNCLTKNIFEFKEMCTYIRKAME